LEKRIQIPKTWIAISILLIMAGSLLAHFFNTSAYNVQVTEISFQTDKGMLNGLLYLPKDAGPADPRPTIITTHGYLNAKEMQDAPAIEMSRRGFVVLALDMYAHGDSYLDSVPLSNPFFAFWTTAMNDAVQYMYNQPYVLKDKAGNAKIAVSGHSMGGFSSTMAAAMDEQAYQKNLTEGTPAVRKIAAVLTAGSDFRWTSYLGIDAKAYNAGLANRTAGAIAAQYDEFFFEASAYATGNTMVKKDYANTADGMEFLGNPADPKEGVFFSTPAGGKRIIYQPKETHPWNHFSIKTTAYEIQFYNAAFEGSVPKTSISGTGQIWRLKEYSEFIAALIIAIVSLVKRKEEKAFLGWIITSIGAFLVFGLTVGAGNVFKLSPYFNEPQTNAVIFWAVFVVDSLSFYKRKFKSCRINV
jgi:pimeloyl-ACP methyl ester carboxylesterase